MESRRFHGIDPTPDRSERELEEALMGFLHHRIPERELRQIIKENGATMDRATQTLDWRQLPRSFRTTLRRLN